MLTTVFFLMDASLCLKAALLLICIAGLLFYRAYWRVDPTLRSIPHLQPEFLLGSTRQMGILAGESIAQGLVRLHAQTGSPPMLQVWLGRHHFITLHSPQLIKTLFSHHKVFLGATPFLDSLLLALFPAGNIVNFDGEMHRRLSTILVPVLRKSRLHVWIPLMIQKADTLVDLWIRRSRSNLGALCTLPRYEHLKEDFRNIVLDVVGTVVMGSDLHSLDEAVVTAREEQLKFTGDSAAAVQPLAPHLFHLSAAERSSASQLVAAIDEINGAFSRLLMSSLAPFLSKVLLRLNFKYQHARRILVERSARLFQVATRIQARQEDVEEWRRDQTDQQDAAVTPSAENSSSNTDTDVASREAAAHGLTPHFRDTALFMFSKAVERGVVSQPLAHDSLFGLQAAAAETSIATFSWLAWFLSKNPRVQERMQAELKAHDLMPIPNTDSVFSVRNPTADDLDSLIYCDAVVKETFRLGVASAGGFRVCGEDNDLLGVPLKKGQQIMWATPVMHRDAQHYTDPNAFAPERFVERMIDDDIFNTVQPGCDVNHHSHAMLSFGGGAHGCPGRYMAWQLIKTTLVRLVQHGVTFEDPPALVVGQPNGNEGGHFSSVSIFPKAFAPTVHIRARISSANAEK